MSDIDRAISALRFYQEIENDIARLIGLVQENQDFFGDPPAGESCVRIATDKLEQLIKSKKNDQTANQP